MELKANELRLNNLVTLNHKVREELFHNQIHAQNEYFEVLTIYSDGDILLKLDDENVELDVKEIEPIPLTEEWLLKFGFEKEFDGSFKKGFIAIFIDKRFNKNVFLQTSENSKDWFGVDLKIQFVHQLQNLYFALTNKELEIKM